MDTEPRPTVRSTFAQGMHRADEDARAMPDDLDRLRIRVTDLEQLLRIQEKAVAEQARRLDQARRDLEERAQALARSEEAVQQQSRIIQSILDSIGDGVVVADGSGKFLLFNPAAVQILGVHLTETTYDEWTQRYRCYRPDRVTPYQPDELPLARANRGEDVNEAEEFMRHERRPEGLWLSVTARPLRDANRVVRGGVAVFRDITARKRAERHLAVQYAVARVLAEAANLDEATPRIVQAVCECLGWIMGAIWAMDGDHLRCVDVWHTASADIEEFERVTRDKQFTIGVGLPGRVWATGKPAWIEDVVTDPNFPRAPFAAQAGLHGAFGFPIRFQDRMTGVIEFFSREVRSPDEDLLLLFEALGSQIGQFLERRRVEEASQRNHAILQAIADGTTDAIFVKDLEGRYLVINGAGAYYLGKNVADVIGKDDSELFTAETAGTIMERDQQVMASGQTMTFEDVGTAAGVTRIFLSTKGPYRDLEGNVIGVIGIARDITDRKQSEQALRDSEALYHSLVESLPLNILRKDRAGRFTFANHLFSRTLRRPLEEIIDRTDFDFFPPHLAEKYRADDRLVMESGKIFEDIEEHVKPDGDKLYVQVIKAPVRDANDDVVGVQILFWDVSDRKRAEEAQKRTAAELARSNQELEQFAYVASQDLQEPLRMVGSFCQLLQRRYKGKIDADADEFINFAVDGALRMQALINDLLAYSRVGTKGKPFQQVESNTMMEKALANLRVAIEETTAVVTHDALPPVMGDTTQLVQLFQNLVGNAIKFRGDRPPAIHIGVRPHYRSWEFAVRDSGIGIDPQEFERIFIIFQRLHTREEYPGTGLGLAICKKIVERHGGRIWVESAPGTGSTFLFTLPMLEEQPA